MINSTRLCAPGRLLCAPLLLAFGACQSAPPAAHFAGPGGVVRADDTAEAEEVSDLFESLRTRVTGLLPDAANRAKEIWVQETPELYRFSGDSYSEADGFWSEGHGRIHLRRDAQSVPRTLAHELVHASLGESWDALPGTIEEGLCDVVSVMLCPEDAADMRTGRLSAAAFATGGLELEVQLFLPGNLRSDSVEIGSMTRVRLMANTPPSFSPAEVFTLEAGLSSTHMPIDDKKALYGLSYLVVDRIIARRGFLGLHRLCLKARATGHDEVPSSWLLEAADMADATLFDWRVALQEAIGTAELQTLVDLYPNLLTDSAARFLGSQTRVEVDRSGAAPLLASVRVSGSQTMLDLRLGLETSLAVVQEGHFRRE